jgi:predicted dehydrogenase
MAKKETDYSLQGQKGAHKIKAPQLNYLPPKPKKYNPNIGLIGCGGITATHLTAYKEAGFNIVALCDINRENAEKRREFFPEAQVYTDAKEVLKRDDIEVLDIATHPPERVPLLKEALKARKHVLSQKPFVLDLDTGEKLADLADEKGVKLAVNQNGRWAPHFSYIRHAVQENLIGDLLSVHVRVHWDHTWIAGTPFENIHDIIFYDFAIHWFDFVATLLGERKATRVQASKTRALGQTMKPPLLAQSLIEFEGGQASLVFDAPLPYGPHDTTYVGGTRGSILSTGPNLGEQSVTLYLENGSAKPKLKGSWFPGGFAGTMGELLCAIEENRPPQNNARDNLKSLALCFAAIQASTAGKPQVPGEVRKLPKGAVPTKTKGSR